MRQIMGLTLVAAVAILGSSGAGRAEEDAKAVVAKAIQAAGGAETLAKYKASTWKEKGTFYGLGDGLPYTAQYAQQAPDHFRMEVTGIFTIVVDGDHGWVKSQEGGGDTKDLNKDQLADQKEALFAGWIQMLEPLQRPGFQLTRLGEQTIDGRPAIGIKVSHKGHRDVNLFFDKQTGLLAKSETIVKDEQQQGKEVKQEAWYSDHKDVEGLKVPTKIKVNRDNKKFVEAEVSDYKPAEKLDRSKFAKP